MNIFKDGGWVRPFRRKSQGQGNQGFDFGNQFFHEDDEATNQERLIENMANVLKKGIVFYGILIVMVVVILLSAPLLKLVYEFSIWALKRVGIWF